MVDNDDDHKVRFAEDSGADVSVTVHGKESTVSITTSGHDVGDSMPNSSALQRTPSYSALTTQGAVNVKSPERSHPRLENTPLNAAKIRNLRVYSEQEVQLLYELGRLFIENGELRKAEVIFKGIVAVEPTFVAAWLGLAYLYHYSSQTDEGISAAKKVVQLEPGSVEGSLFLAVFLYSSSEISAAGAILGEIREKVEAGSVKDPNILRIYRSQVERFSSR